MKTVKFGGMEDVNHELSESALLKMEILEIA